MFQLGQAYSGGDDVVVLGLGRAAGGKVVAVGGEPADVGVPAGRSAADGRQAAQCGDCLPGQVPGGLQVVLCGLLQPGDVVLSADAPGGFEGGEQAGEPG